MAFVRASILLSVLITLVGCAKNNTKIEDEMPDAGACYDRGVAAFESENYDLAIHEFTQAIELSAANGEEYPDAYNGRGICWEKQGDYKCAFRDFGEAIRLDPSLSDAYFNRALAYFNTKGYEKALVDYDKGLQLNPQFASAWHNRGAIFHDQGNYGAAIDQYTRAIELDPVYLLAYCNRANAEYSFGLYSEAIEDFAKAASICAGYGDFEGAARWQSQALEFALDEQKPELSAKLNEYMMQARAQVDKNE